MAGSVLCIVGGKGGVGCTSVAIELGQALARRGKIAIVDGDFSGRRSIAILLNGIKELDQARDPDGNLSFATLRSGVTAVEMAPNIHAGFTPKPGQTCVVHYTGWLYENGVKGKKFDSSVDRKTPFAFVLGEHKVIEGWERGVSTMKVGGKRTLIIPPSLGYGPAGSGTIPPNSTLIFEVELLNVRA